MMRKTKINEARNLVIQIRSLTAESEFAIKRQAQDLVDDGQFDDQVTALNFILTMHEDAE